MQKYFLNVSIVAFQGSWARREKMAVKTQVRIARKKVSSVEEEHHPEKVVNGRGI